VGDLYVQVIVKEHPLFQREGEHVILDLPITFVQASLGAEIEVPTLGGTAPLKIPGGIQPGTIVKLRGKGIKRLNGAGFGDQIIRVLVETPTHLTQRQKELLRQFEQDASGDSQPGIASFLQKFKEIFK
jgi:molecular chaperone DnaJ